MAQLTAFTIAVKALIDTHPNGQEFADAFRARLAEFQVSPTYMEAGAEVRQLLRDASDSLLEDVR